MGCAFAKSSSSDQGDSGPDNSKGKSGPISEPPEPPASDPRLPLTTRQKFSISKSWKGISRALEPTGINMFIRLFEENHELLDIFVKFRDSKTKEQQLKDEALAKHATTVMETLDEAICSLDKVDYFISYLEQIGAQHRNIPGFKPEYFWKIEKPFLDAVRETLDERYTENIEEIYKITVKFILETMITGYEKSGEGG